eukprot:Skav218386  [mRNA]  locus=scaffold2066:404308:405384:- [translate_table: standard]
MALDPRTRLTQCAACCDEEGGLEAIHAGAGSGKRERETGYTALHYACQYGLLDLVTALLRESDADVNLQTKDLILSGAVVQSGGQTPLHLATRAGEAEVVSLLLTCAVDLSLVDYDGFTAMELAQFRQKENVFALLKAASQFKAEFEDPEALEVLKQKALLAQESAKLRSASQLEVPDHLRQSYTIPKVWSAEECNFVLNALKDAVSKRESGWTTDRHAAYATTDVPCSEVTEIDAWVRESLSTRVFSKLASRHGWSYEGESRGLYFRDLFFVKYSVDGQAGLALHRDGSIVSFNVLLNQATEFEGGGTYVEADDCAYQIDQGDCFVHSGKLRHGGQPVTKGERFILVAFVDVDTERA